MSEQTVLTPSPLTAVPATSVPTTAVPAAAVPTTEKGRVTRRRLLESAEQLFESRGYANVRITDITSHASLSAGAFYRYFEDRHELTLELLRELTSEMYLFIRSPFDESDPIRSALESTRKYFEFYAGHRALFGLLVELSQTDAEVAALWDTTKRTFYARIARALRRGVTANLIRADLDPDLAAEMLGSMTEFYAFQRFVLGGSGLTDTSIEDATRTIAEIWISGMGRQPKSEHALPE